MKLTKKRTCTGCKAFSAITLNECALGYPIMVTRFYNGKAYSYAPLRCCPKPKTAENYFFLLHDVDK